MEALNDDLLAAAAGTEEEQPEEEPKRNTKDDLISKILKLCEEQNIELEQSNSKLRRMSKKALSELLAEKLEVGITNAMAEKVGVPQGSDARMIGLGALRMVHDLCANLAETGANSILPKYGFEVNGFTAALNRPHVKEAVDSCLEEIAAESDVLEYVKSPYTRLGIAWMGALASSTRKCRRLPPPPRPSGRRVRFKPAHRTNEAEDAPRMGPRAFGLAPAMERRAYRGPPDGQEHGGGGPPREECKSV